MILRIMMVMVCVVEESSQVAVMKAIKAVIEFIFVKASTVHFTAVIIAV